MRALALAILFLITACSSPRTYELIPPKSADGQQCVEHCFSENKTCFKQCESTGAQCRKKEQQRAQSDYDSYSMMQGITGRTASKNEGDFYRGNSCQSSERCDANCGVIYRSCYRTCGGTVITH